MTHVTFVTSESVTEGHPDKICDQISDAILDNLIAQDPDSRVAIECLTTTGTVIVAGEVTTQGYADIQRIVRATLKEIGYTNPEFGIDHEDAGVLIAIHGQSPDISQGVTEKSDHEQGAGDQGMMYGFACDETPELMPLPIILSHKLTRRLAEVRKSGLVAEIGPDGKSQVSVEYHDRVPKRLTAVVISTQHLGSKPIELLREEILAQVIRPVCGDYMDAETKVYINPTGRFVIGGPEGDTGVTGRKIIVDTYGGVGRHGGGAFSVQGGSLGRLCRPLRREEHRRGRTGEAMRSAAQLRDRGGPSDFDQRRHFRHELDSRRADRGSRAQAFQPDAERDRLHAQTQASDL
jgi:S-adenosylmethionine synthetase